MLEFQRIAVAISEKTYKKEIGWTFQSSTEFGQSLVTDAGNNAVRGLVLYGNGVPAAYVFCRIQNSIIYYTHIGYDPQFSESSPGTVLLYVLLERLFAEQAFTYLDFLGGVYWQYKQVYSTVQLPSVTLLYARPGPYALAMIAAHLTVRKLEALSSRVKRLFNLG
jgi:CelD/BcsL family acetyltransferase involved in cellulose biosynthesis